VLISAKRFKELSGSSDARHQIARTIATRMLGNAPADLVAPQIKELEVLTLGELAVLLPVEKLPLARAQRDCVCTALGRSSPILDRLEKRFAIARAIAEATGEGLYEAVEHATSGSDVWDDESFTSWQGRRRETLRSLTPGSIISVKRFLGWLVALLAGSAGCGASAKPCTSTYVAPKSVSRGFLYEVTGPKGSIVLFGTHHAAARDDIPKAAFAALGQAAVFVVEVEEVGVGDRYSPGEDWNKAFRLLPGQSLMKMLPADDFTELAWILDVEPMALTRLKPWAAMFRVLARAFTLPHPNLPQALADHARDKGIASEFLASWEEQVAFLDASAGAAKLVESIHDYPNIKCRLADRVAAYRAGDDAAFADDVGESDPIVPRLAAWTVKIEAYLTSGRRAFVALGVANLVGPFGLVARLQGRGYRIRRL
jgi:uncharacterized protein YbaP (TraB family)